jgi:hypothetical protein
MDRELKKCREFSCPRFCHVCTNWTHNGKVNPVPLFSLIFYLPNRSTDFCDTWHMRYSLTVATSLSLWWVSVQ